MGIIDQYSIGQQTVDQTLETKVNPIPDPFIAGIDEQWITFGSITCRDAYGDVIESYPQIQLARDVVGYDRFTLCKGALHFEEAGSFLPSFALTCNLLVLLYLNQSDRDCRVVLEQYKDVGHGVGWHVQNTIVDYSNTKIIHYPSNADLPEHSRWQRVNAPFPIRKSISFDTKGLIMASLQCSFLKPTIKVYLQSLTGMQDLESLADISEFFEKKPIVSAAINGKRSTWLGSTSDYFFLTTDCGFNKTSLARAVRIPEK